MQQPKGFDANWCLPMDVWIFLGVLASGPHQVSVQVSDNNMDN